MNNRKTNSLYSFFIVLAFEIALTAYLILDKRMVIGHDGFFSFSVEWFLHNSKIVYNQIPLWTPYVAHGASMASLDVFSTRVGMPANALLLFSGWLNSINFLPIFHGEFFVEKMILLIGVWLLGQRYFSSIITLFFVATCVMSSCVVLSQYSFTLTLFYTLPLILYLLHLFLDTGRGGWFLAAVYLFFLQTIGNVVYFIPILSLAIFIYFFSFFYVQKGLLIGSFQRILKYKQNILWGLGVVILAGLWITLMYLAKDPQMVFFSSGRNGSGETGLHDFLTYGGHVNLLGWWDMLLRVSPGIDYTVYIGMLGLPLVLVGAFCSKNSNKYPFVWGTIIFLLFSLGTPISVLAYYFWPLMKFYRHIAYVAPLIKLYLCFLAGFGFEQVFHKDNSKEDKAIFYQNIFVAGALFLNSLFLCQLVIHADIGYSMVPFLDPHLPQFQDQNAGYFVSKDFFNAALISFMLSIVIFLRSWIPSTRYASFILILLILHCLDVYSYAFQQIQLRSFSLTPKEYALMNFGRIPFIDHRLQAVDKLQNARQEIVNSLWGATYDTSSNFTLTDVVKSPYRSDFSLKPLIQLRDVNDDVKSPVFLKLVGATEDKIQFFSDAYAEGSNEAISSAMKNKNYAGDVLFYQSPDQSKEKDMTDLQKVDLSQNQRLKIPYKVLFFSPNEIIISIDTLKKAGVWMQYCDVWHPSWKAQVNGHSQQLYIGNLAYKALPLGIGKNIVRLYYDSKLFVCLYYFFMFSALGGIIFSIGLFMAYFL